MPYPVGPAAAGSTPSTRRLPFLAGELAAVFANFIDLSLRRSPRRFQRFVAASRRKRKTAIPRGKAVPETEGSAPTCRNFRLVCADGRLNLRDRKSVV